MDKRDNLRPWKPGQSGNPSGSNGRDRNLRALLNKRFGKDSHVLIDELQALACEPHGDPKVRVKAIELLLAYQHGRPMQAFMLEQDTPAVLQVTFDDPGATPRRPG